MKTIWSRYQHPHGEGIVGGALNWLSLLCLAMVSLSCSDVPQDIALGTSAMAPPQTWRAWWYELKYHSGPRPHRYDFNPARGTLVDAGPIASDALYIVRPSMREQGPFESEPTGFDAFDQQHWLLARAQDQSEIYYDPRQRSGDWFFVSAQNIELPDFFIEHEGRWYVNQKWYPASWPLRERKRFACPVSELDATGHLVPAEVKGASQFSLALHDAWDIWFDEQHEIQLGSGVCKPITAPRNVLVVEDSDDNRHALVETLNARTDWEVFEAATLSEGQSLLRDHTSSGQPFDVIISDQSLGWGDDGPEYGTDLLIEAMQISPATYRALVTGGASDDRIAAANQQGALHKVYLKARYKPSALQSLILLAERHFAILTELDSPTSP